VLLEFCCSKKLKKLQRFKVKVKGKGKKYSRLQLASQLRELMCHMGSQYITKFYLPPGRGDISCLYPSQVKLVLDLATAERCEGELTYIRPGFLAHPVDNGVC